MTPTAPQTTEERPVELREQAPSPDLFVRTAFGFQQTAAIKAAIELDVFTAMADGAATADKIAERCTASARGVRILCDYLTIHRFLTKEDGHYALTNDSFMFLNRRSPAYIGSAVEFLTSPEHLEAFSSLTEIVRRGTRDERALEPDNPMWVKFARAMAPMQTMPAALLADFLGVSNAGPTRVLDIAAGHGLFGITVARENTQARVTAVDWPTVLEVARENARSAGVSDRLDTIAGDARSVDLGSGYDLALVPNFLHHFDVATNTRFLEKMYGVLNEGGRIAILEFVPDEDRVNPPIAASFAMTMLGLTAAGDAYTFNDLKGMLAAAGFRNIGLHPLPPIVHKVVTANR